MQTIKPCQSSFRPLSRWIGSYTDELPNYDEQDQWFPSPLEVDRFLYDMEKVEKITNLKFPSPLEVDRFLYSPMSIRIMKQC